MLSLYAVDTAYVSLAQGHFVNFIVGGTATDFANDSIGPQIEMYLNSPSFVDGDDVNATPTLVVELYDENGINTMGTGIGHNITAMVDNNPLHTYNLNSAFVPAVGDYKRGTISMPLNRLDAGEHTLTLRAWDLYNNSSFAKLTFNVDPSLAPGFVELKVNPAPVIAGSPAVFTLVHDRPQSEIDVRIDVFNVQGLLMWSNSEQLVCDGNTYSCSWSAVAQGGQPLSTGVYIVRAYITEGGVTSATKTVKFVVVNNK